MSNAKRDDNYIPTLLAVSNADGTTPVTLYADPTTHRLLVSGGGNATYIAATTTYPILTTDEFVDCTSGTFTVTLPTAVGVTGKRYIIKNSGAGTITLATTSGQTIDGQASAAITLPTQYGSVTVLSDGANWKIVG